MTTPTTFEPIAEALPVPEDHAYLLRLSHGWYDGPLLFVEYLKGDATWDGAYHDGSPVKRYTKAYFYEDGDEIYDETTKFPAGYYLLDSDGLRLLREFDDIEKDEHDG